MSTHTELLDLVRRSTLAVIEVPIELFLEDANLRDYVVKGKNCLSLNNMHMLYVLGVLLRNCDEIWDIVSVT